MPKLIFVFAALSGMISVMLGAFASHALRGKLDDRLQHAFETAVSYQLSHSLLLVIACVLLEHWGRHWALVAATWSLLAGVILFCGSLYLLCLTGLKWPGPVTPLGGLALIAGWGLLAIGIWQNTQQ